MLLSDLTKPYRKKFEIERIVDGVPVRLALQFKNPRHVEIPWWVLSWRTHLPGKNRNRRFYFSKGKFWNIPSDAALDMMQDAEKRGGLKDEYLDPRPYSNFETIVSSETAAADKAEWLRLLTAPGEDWGSDPFFAVVSDPDENWRKAMIVNADNGMSTFRGLTKDPDHPVTKKLRADTEWRLDNSMPDANVQQMRQFLRHLAGRS